MSTADASSTRSHSSRTAMLMASLVLAVTAVAASSYGIAWAVTANDESVSLAIERDDALRVGRNAIVNFNTLDHRNVQHGLDLWAQSSTGQLHEEVVKGRDANAKRIEQAKTSTHAEVLDAGLTEINPRAGKARMIAVVKVTVTPEGKPPVEKRSRYQAELSREGEQWKLSMLGSVPSS